MLRLNAVFSRNIFTDPDYVPAEEEERVSLYNSFGKETEALPIHLRFNEIEDKLEKMIEEGVNVFEREMDAAFCGVAGYSRDKVQIFMAGNASRNKFVQQSMHRHFKSNVHFVDHSGKADRYSVNPKTAAFGQLMLNNVIVTGDGARFGYYVGYVSGGSGEWVLFRRIINRNTDIYYSQTSCADGGTPPKKQVNTDGMTGKNLFIRVKDEVSVEYCVSASQDAPSDEEAAGAVTLKLN